MTTGRIIARKRRELHMTQEQLAEKVGVKPQAISRWENDWNLPELDKLCAVARALGINVGTLIGGSTLDYEWELRDQMFSEKNMFTRLKTIAEISNLPQTYKALYYIREQHKGQYRKKLKFSDARIPYIIHPLMMACHAQAMGIMDDETLAVILLHDVCEDCGVDPKDLPFSERVKKAVDLLTKKEHPGLTKDEYTREYYDAIAGNETAAIVKALDRCNNVSTMALSFNDQKLSDYIEETETYVIPLLVSIKHNSVHYNNAVFIIKYHMLSVLESLKAMLLGKQA